MSAYGPKRTWVDAPHMSAFGGKADMVLCGNSLSRSLLGVKRTWLVAAHMSAFDPKRTSPFLQCKIDRRAMPSRNADLGYQAGDFKSPSSVAALRYPH